MEGGGGRKGTPNQAPEKSGPSEVINHYLFGCWSVGMGMNGCVLVVVIGETMCRMENGARFVGEGDDDRKGESGEVRVSVEEG